MTPHPRLWAGSRELNRLKEPPRLPLLRQTAARLAAAADEYARSPRFDCDTTVHNAHLIRARIQQTRVVTLLARWLQTGERRFRDAAVTHVREMATWEYWSWITWRWRDSRPTAIYDLSYGENAATLALAYDWLFSSLSREERGLFLALARRWVFASFLRSTEGRKKKAWWFGHPDCNWNTVCAGGAGLLALALHEECPAAPEILRRVEASVAPFMRTLDTLHGGWPEGVGYWNYGMRYAFMYLLSHERATGREHPLLKRPGVRATLDFPLHFCPHGTPCSFGDVNAWRPLPFHWAAAERLGRRDLFPALDAAWASGDPRRGGAVNWPDDAEWLMFHPRGAAKPSVPRPDALRLYRGLDWGILADRWPAPRLYLSVRGGSTEVSHAHRDLLSFHAVVGGEPLVTNVNVGEYLDTTFSRRRWELFETMPASKNTLLINGVGIAQPAAVKTRPVVRPGLRGFHLDATAAMGVSREGAAADFCARLFLMVAGKAVLIIDRVELPHFGRVEARFHTFARAVPGEAGAVIRGKKASLRLACAADVPAVLCTAVGAPTTPGKGAAMLRWCTARLHEAVTLLTVLAPGSASATAKLAWTRGRLIVTAKGTGWSCRIALTKHLRLA